MPDIGQAQQRLGNVEMIPATSVTLVSRQVVLSPPIWHRAGDLTPKNFRVVRQASSKLSRLTPQPPRKP
jgi:hypothetical protein